MPPVRFDIWYLSARHRQLETLLFCALYIIACVLSSHSAFITSITLAPVPRYLIVVDEFLQFISMDDNMQATHLGKAELFSIYTRKTHLKEKRITSNTVFNIGE